MLEIKGVREFIANQCDSVAKSIDLIISPKMADLQISESLKRSSELIRNKYLSENDLAMVLNVQDIFNVMTALLDGDRQTPYFHAALTGLTYMFATRIAYVADPNLGWKTIREISNMDKR